MTIVCGRDSFSLKLVAQVTTACCAHYLGTYHAICSINISLYCSGNLGFETWPTATGVKLRLAFVQSGTAGTAVIHALIEEIRIAAVAGAISTLVHKYIVLGVVKMR